MRKIFSSLLIAVILLSTSQLSAQLLTKNDSISKSRMLTREYVGAGLGYFGGAGKDTFSAISNPNKQTKWNSL